MKVPLSDIYHLEIFLIGGEAFIKDVLHPAKGNAMRWSDQTGRRLGKVSYVFFTPETLVRRKGPDISVAP